MRARRRRRGRSTGQRPRRRPREEIEQPLLSELARFRIFRFSDAIRVKKQEIAWAHFGAAHLHIQLVKQADWETAGGQRFDRAAGAPDQGGKVAATAIFDIA